MKSEWNTSAIANICKVVTDGSHTSPKSVSHGKYMVSVKDFTPYGFDFNGCRQISFADYEKLKSSGCVPQKGDILIGISGSGNSANVVNAMQYAKDNGGITVAIVGYSGGRMKEMADYSIHVNVNDMQIAEDLHMVLDHMMMWVLSH